MKGVSKTCGACGAEFSHSPSRNYAYCSSACRKAGGKAKRARTCASCGAEFFCNHAQASQRFCSIVCGHAPKVAARRQAPPPSVIVGAVWVPLTRGKWTLVDEADHEAVMRHRWFYDAQGYARSKINGRSTALHLFLIGGARDHKHPVDHENRNRLDNRRLNLRRVTGGQNRVNSEINANNSSGYRGVSYHGGKWTARIGYNMTRRYLGRFGDVLDAAKAYDEAAVKLFGAAAQLNFAVSSQP